MKELKSYHAAWLAAHTNRSEEWLRERIADGFHIHHIDGDHSNDKPENLILIDGADHMALHGMPLRAYARRASTGRRPRKKRSPGERPHWWHEMDRAMRLGYLELK